MNRTDKEHLSIGNVLLSISFQNASNAVWRQSSVVSNLGISFEAIDHHHTIVAQMVVSIEFNVWIFTKCVSIDKAMLQYQQQQQQWQLHRRYIYNDLSFPRSSEAGLLWKCTSNEEVESMRICIMKNECWTKQTQNKKKKKNYLMCEAVSEYNRYCTLWQLFTMRSVYFVLDEHIRWTKNEKNRVIHSRHPINVCTMNKQKQHLTWTVVEPLRSESGENKPTRKKNEEKKQNMKCVCSSVLSSRRHEFEGF